MATEASVSALKLLQQRFPRSVSLPESDTYKSDVHHFLGTSSQPAAFSIQPSSVDDLGEILRTLDRDDIRCPFAIKSGGHALNQGHSSTHGIQISMGQFTELAYNQAFQTVKIGSGLTWYKVYLELEKFGVTVAGGRSADDVGIGLALGGGFSWVTDEHGISLDNITSFDLVRPDGSFIEVTEATESDLFFALKGGMNNFGVITAITMKTHPLGTIWAGDIIYSMEHKDQVISAISEFSIKNTNTKAQIVGCYVHAGPEPIWKVVLFHNGEDIPSVFLPFMDIPSLSKDVGARTLTNFCEMTRLPSSPGGLGHTVPIVHYTLPLLKKIQVLWDQFYAKVVRDGRSITSASFLAEPFINAFKHSTPSAYPHSPDRPLSPTALFITFSDPQDADYFHDEVWNIYKAILQASVEEGQSKVDDIHYPNYCIGDTPLELIYGENLPRLREIKEKVDPKNVMGLTGGFKI